MIVRATIQDVPELVRVINAAYDIEKFFVAGDRTDAETVTSMLATGAFLIVRATSGDVRDAGRVTRMDGCVYLELRSPRAYFGMLAVDPQAQGRGLGRFLVHAAEAEARSAGCTAMDIRIVNLRTELPPFYRRLGYADTGVTEAADEPRALRPFHFVNMSKPL